MDGNASPSQVFIFYVFYLYAWLEEGTVRASQVHNTIAYGQGSKYKVLSTLRKGFPTKFSVIQIYPNTDRQQLYFAGCKVAGYGAYFCLSKQVTIKPDR